MPKKENNFIKRGQASLFKAAVPKPNTPQIFSAEDITLNKITGKTDYAQVVVIESKNFEKEKES